MERYTTGGNVDSYCMKCKLSQNHTIVSMDGDAITQVECLVCHGKHKFRTAPPVKRTSAGKRASAAQKAPVVIWEEALKAAKGKELPYSMAAKFRVGDIVVHDRFGKGVVLRLHQNKCDVLFQDKERLMASAN